MTLVKFSEVSTLETGSPELDARIEEIVDFLSENELPDINEELNTVIENIKSGKRKSHIYCDLVERVKTALEEKGDEKSIDVAKNLKEIQKIISMNLWLFLETKNMSFQEAIYANLLESHHSLHIFLLKKSLMKYILFRTLQRF